MPVKSSIMLPPPLARVQIQLLTFWITSRHFISLPVKQRRLPGGRGGAAAAAARGGGGAAAAAPRPSRRSPRSPWRGTPGGPSYTNVFTQPAPEVDCNRSRLH